MQDGETFRQASEHDKRVLRAADGVRYDDDFF
jgi:hypothetical protein